MVFFTTIGDYGLVWISLSLALLAFPRTRSTGLVSLLALAIGTLAGDVVLKPLIQRARPFVDLPHLHLLIPKPGSYSFPSGHTTASFAAATVLGHDLRRLAPVIWTVAGLIAFSRLYLLVHYPTDVLAGIVLGLSSGYLTLKLARRSSKSAPVTGSKPPLPRTALTLCCCESSGWTWLF